jgi:hypothetical protein
VPEHGEYLLYLRSGYVPLASIPPPRGHDTTTIYFYFERAEVAALLRELGADADAFLATIPDRDWLTAREQEWLPGGLRFAIEQQRERSPART